MDDVHCYGNETFLEDCTFNWWGVHNCGHGEDVSISCLKISSSNSSTTVSHTTTNTTTPFVRLVGKPEAGRLEVYHDGKWGTVCEDGFNDVAATVTCRSLGFGYGELINGEPYRTRNGTIWLDEVRCRGNEASILECSNSGWQQHRCEHSQDVAIECYHKSLTAIASDSTTFPVVAVMTAIVVGGVVLLAAIISLTCVLVKRNSRSNIEGKKPEGTRAAATADLVERHDVSLDEHQTLSSLSHYQPAAAENAYNNRRARATASKASDAAVMSTYVDEDGYDEFKDEELYINQPGSDDLYGNIRFQ
jgi:hypothetical protein